MAVSEVGGWSCAVCPGPGVYCSAHGNTRAPLQPPAVVCRFCKYPQEVVLRLEHTSKVQQIQILSHEYKVRGERAPAARCVP